MDLSLLLTIIGTIATLVFGFLSIDLFRRKKYPGKISFVHLNSLSLFNRIAKNFEEISILHNSEPIKENIIYLQGAFVNVGTIDINGTIAEKDISIELPDNYRWLKCKITKVSNDLKCESSISGDKVLDFNLGLFRRNEFFEFEALIEAENNAKRYNEIASYFIISHRIANTQKIDRTNIIPENKINENKRSLRIYLITIFALLILCISFVIFDLFFPGPLRIQYRVVNTSNNEYIFYAEGKNDNTIHLKEVNGDRETTVPLVEFQNKEKYIPMVHTNTISDNIEKYFIGMGPFLLLYILYILSDFIDIKKAKKSNSILTWRK